MNESDYQLIIGAVITLISSLITLALTKWFEFKSKASDREYQLIVAKSERQYEEEDSIKDKQSQRIKLIIEKLTDLISKEHLRALNKDESFKYVAELQALLNKNDMEERALNNSLNSYAQCKENGRTIDGDSDMARGVAHLEQCLNTFVLAYYKSTHLTNSDASLK